jgi:hypothetical protein
MGLYDAIGLAGVLSILIAYAAAQLRRLDPTGVTSLLMNLGGACLIMVSLSRAFNLSAFLMEATWAGVAIFGLARRGWEGARARLQGKRGADDPGS